MAIMSSCPNYGPLQWDLNNQHLINGNIWIANFHLSGIQMLGIQMPLFLVSASKTASENAPRKDAPLRGFFFKNTSFRGCF